MNPPRVESNQTSINQLREVFNIENPFNTIMTQNIHLRQGESDSVAKHVSRPQPNTRGEF